MRKIFLAFCMFIATPCLGADSVLYEKITKLIEDGKTTQARNLMDHASPADEIDAALVTEISPAGAIDHFRFKVLRTRSFLKDKNLVESLRSLSQVMKIMHSLLRETVLPGTSRAYRLPQKAVINKDVKAEFKSAFNRLCDAVKDLASEDFLQCVGILYKGEDPGVTHMLGWLLSINHRNDAERLQAELFRGHAHLSQGKFNEAAQSLQAAVLMVSALKQADPQIMEKDADLRRWANQIYQSHVLALLRSGDIPKAEMAKMEMYRAIQTDVGGFESWFASMIAGQIYRGERMKPLEPIIKRVRSAMMKEDMKTLQSFAVDGSSAPAQMQAFMERYDIEYLTWRIVDISGDTHLGAGSRAVVRIWAEGDTVRKGDRQKIEEEISQGGRRQTQKFSTLNIHVPTEFFFNIVFVFDGQTWKIAALNAT